MSRKEKARHEAEGLVRALYRGMLGREVDPDGLAHWTHVLLSGMASPAGVAQRFLDSEEFRRRTAVKLFVPPGHYYSPVVDPAEAAAHLAAVRATDAAAVAGIAIDHAAMVSLWRELVPLFASCPFPARKTSPYRYYFENESYAWGDGSMLHAMLRHVRPKRLIEVGSGWSSACTLDTVERFLDGDCRITMIEPYPELLRELVPKMPANVEVVAKRVQDVPPALFETLSAGDVLFIDSTHVMRTGSDVCFELFEILPRLAPGVLVHFHDMFWPFEYPDNWAITDNRSWNELYAVRAFLTGNDDWKIVMFNDYMAQRERAEVEVSYPAFLRNPGGALWMQRM
jgi:hypothetical protein